MKRMARVFTGSALVAVLMFGCAPRLMATGDPLYTPEFEGSPQADTTNAVMSDGARLPLRSWSAETPHAVIVAVHGMNDYSNASALPGPWFA